jgi:hypothetical protein
MSTSSHPDDYLSRLRASVAEIERHIAALPTCLRADDRSREASQGLAASWAALVEQLALGPEPERRQCPVCKRSGMLAAFRCGYCWTKFPTAADGTLA